MSTVKGYEKLVAVYQDAHDQAAKGKGKERHANDLPFEKQRMLSISELINNPGGMTYQAIKKLTEGLQFEDHARREAELLGALNYIAGIVIYYRELQPMVSQREYTLEEVTRGVMRGVTLSDWVKWVAVDSDGEVWGYQEKPEPSTAMWYVKVGELCKVINKVVPPLNFKNCIWRVSK